MTTTEAEVTRTPAQTMIDLLTGFWVSRALYVAARLGLADLVGEQPMPVAELARRTGTHADSLYRVMRALAGADIFEEHPDRRFSQTELSAMLRSDVPGSLRYTAISELGEDHYAAWEEILYSVRTGRTAFCRRFGTQVWQYYAENPDLGRVFERSMSGLTQRIHEAIVSAYPFLGFDRILDVGGGEGCLLARVLERNRLASGMLCDRPEVISFAAERLRQNGAAGRILPVAGDFFQEVPAGADLHLLKWIIHDWNDEHATRILRNCRASLEPAGRLLLIETVIPETKQGLFPKLLDLNMMVMTGGRERTEDEFRRLLGRAGLRLRRVLPPDSPVSLLEAEAA